MKYYIKESIFLGDTTHVADLDTIEIIFSQEDQDSLDNLKDAFENCTFDDYKYKIYGYFDTLEEAREKIFDIFGDVRTEEEQNVFQFEDPEAVETFKHAGLIEMSDSESGDFVYECISASIMYNELSATSTDEKLFLLEKEYEEEARDAGYTISCDITCHLQERRKELIDDLEEDSE